VLLLERLHEDTAALWRDRRDKLRLAETLLSMEEVDAVMAITFV
jgi:hypothetical protein